MGVHQETIEVRTPGRGMRDVTPEVEAVLRRSGLRGGTLTVFCRHTSCSLIMMENADPTARSDLENYFCHIAPDGDPRYVHDAEGPDDMSAHLRMVLTRTSESIPFSNGRLTLGTWQGLFLWEHRTSPHRRSLVVSIVGE